MSQAIYILKIYEDCVFVACHNISLELFRVFVFCCLFHWNVSFAFIITICVNVVLSICYLISEPKFKGFRSYFFYKRKYRKYSIFWILFYFILFFLCAIFFHCGKYSFIKAVKKQKSTTTTTTTKEKKKTKKANCNPPPAP